MDTASLLTSLNEHEVHYVVIGAMAFPVHGYGRTTLDVDIFIRPTKSNAERTLAALRAMGYDTTDASAEDALTYKLLFREYALQTDVHPFVSGADFDRVWANKVPATIEGVQAFVASLDDLILMKQAAGRPRDLEDLKILRKLKQRQQR